MATSEAFGWFPVGLLLLAMRNSVLLLPISLGSSANALAASGGQGCLLCFESAGPDSLSPSTAIIKGLCEPGLNEKFTMSSMITLAGGTVLIGMDIIALVGVSTVDC